MKSETSTASSPEAEFEQRLHDIEERLQGGVGSPARHQSIVSRLYTLRDYITQFRREQTQHEQRLVSEERDQESFAEQELHAKRPVLDEQQRQQQQRLGAMIRRINALLAVLDDARPSMDA